MNPCNHLPQIEELENHCDQVWNFVTEPNLHPMKVTLQFNQGFTAPGNLFLAPFTLFGATMIGQTGAYIMAQDGEPIWFLPLSSRFIQNANFRVQTYCAKPVLTMWQGTISGTYSDTLNLPAVYPFCA